MPEFARIISKRVPKASLKTMKQPSCVKRTTQNQRNFRLLAESSFAAWSTWRVKDKRAYSILLFIHDMLNLTRIPMIH
jgi:hypothetical protein